MKPERIQQNFLFVALLILIPILIFAGSLALFFMGSTSPVPYECEIGWFSGTVELYSHKARSWTTVTRKTHRQISLSPRDKIRIGADSNLDLKIPNAYDLRLKFSTEVEILPHKHSSNPKALRFKLLKGSIFGLPDKESQDQTIEIETPALLTHIPHASFMVQVTKNGQSSIEILDGTVQVHTHQSKEVIHIQALEMLTATRGEKTIPKPKRVNYQEWRFLNEVRDLTTVTVQEVAEQVDLRKKAGSFFNYVFDEGVFFKPNWGYAEREFYQDEDTKAVILRLHYDVYPQDSYSGMYFKIRGLDLSQVQRLTFSMKGAAGKPLPNQLRIEFKDKFSIVRGFSIKPVTEDWRFYAFDFNAQKPTFVSEMVFVFENSRIGPLSTKGAVYLKDLQIE
ncbi:MAG: FecR domain-containing protein [Candidatus Omnitrophica bacterium]|nr:FecR domain-containing protein [Candidatus Omnitrophota bacterium]